MQLERNRMYSTNSRCTLDVYVEICGDWKNQKKYASGQRTAAGAADAATTRRKLTAAALCT